MKRREPDSPASFLLFIPFFYICRRDGCSPAGIVPGVVAVSIFVEKKEKKKKKKKKEWRGGVSKKEIFFAL